MQKMVFKILGLGVVIGMFQLLVSCSSPLNKVYNRETAEDDYKRITIMAKLDSNQKATMAHFMVEHDLVDPQVLELGATYRDIMDQAIEFRKKQLEKEASDKKLAEKSKKDEIENTALRNKMLKVSATDNGIHDNSINQNVVKYKLTFRNIANKNITAFKGSFYFYDIFGTEVNSLTLNYYEGIPKDNTVEYTTGIDLNIEKAGEKNIISKGFENLKVVWKPEKIIFEDGSSI